MARSTRTARWLRRAWSWRHLSPHTRELRFERLDAPAPPIAAAVVRRARVHPLDEPSELRVDRCVDDVSTEHLAQPQRADEDVGDLGRDRGLGALAVVAVPQRDDQLSALFLGL